MRVLDRDRPVAELVPLSREVSAGTDALAVPRRSSTDDCSRPVRTVHFRQEDIVRTRTCGAEEARANLPALLERAHHGTPVLITKRGRPYAALVPVDRLTGTTRRLAIGALAGSGKGLWGRKSAETVRRMRDEWA